MKFLIPPANNGHPVLKAKTASIMNLIRQQFDYYTEINGKIIFKMRHTLSDPVHAENTARKRFETVMRQIAVSHETHMPRVVIRGGEIRLVDGRNRIAALLASGVDEVSISLDYPSYDPNYDVSADISLFYKEIEKY